MPNHTVTQKIDIKTSSQKLRNLNISEWYSFDTREKLESWNAKRAAVESTANELEEKRGQIADSFLTGSLDNPLSKAQLVADEVLLLSVELLKLTKERSGFDSLIHAETKAEHGRVQDELSEAKAVLTQGLAKLSITSEMAVASAILQDEGISALTANSSSLYRAISKHSGDISQQEKDMAGELEAQIRATIG